MFKEFPDDDNRNDDFLNEFRQKIADQNIENFEERKEELRRSKSIFLGITSGVALAGIVGWMILAPQYTVESEKEIPVIRRPQTAIRVQPSEPGGMDIPNQDKTVYNIIEKKEDSSVENLLPPPENPKLPDLVKEETPQNEQPNVITEAEKVIQKAENQALTTQDIIKQAEEQALVAEKKAAQELKENPQQVAQAKVNTPEPAPKPVDVKKPEPVVKKAEEPKVPAQATKAVVGDWQIQLMSSPNKPAVEKAKIDLGKKYKISHLPFEIESAILDMNKTFYRLKVGAFKTRAEADKLCNNIKNLGGTCIVKKK